MLEKLIGQKIVAIKAVVADKRKKRFLEPVYILLSDKETYLELKEQDLYSYHDCSDCARIITTNVDKIKWKIIMDNVDGCYPDANTLWWG